MNLPITVKPRSLSVIKDEGQKISGMEQSLPTISARNISARFISAQMFITEISACAPFGTTDVLADGRFNLGMFQHGDFSARGIFGTGTFRHGDISSHGRFGTVAQVPKFL